MLCTSILKFCLKILDIFLSMAPLLGHLMSGMRTMAIAGIQLWQIFDIVLLDTLNVYAKSVLLRPSLNFISTTNRWSSRESFWLILSTLPVVFVKSHSKITEVSPVRKINCVMLHLTVAQEKLDFCSSIVAFHFQPVVCQTPATGWHINPEVDCVSG